MAVQVKPAQSTTPLAAVAQAAVVLVLLVQVFQGKAITAVLVTAAELHLLALVAVAVLVQLDKLLHQEQQAVTAETD